MIAINNIFPQLMVPIHENILKCFFYLSLVHGVKIVRYLPIRKTWQFILKIRCVLILKNKPPEKKAYFHVNFSYIKVQKVCFLLNFFKKCACYCIFLLKVHFIVGLPCLRGWHFPPTCWREILNYFLSIN